MKYRTHKPRSDGFGSHYKTIMLAYLYCKWKRIEYVYRPLKDVAHNYENDPEYTNKLETLMNIKPHFKSLDQMKCDFLDGKMINKKIKELPYILNDITDIRNIYWQNKDRDYSRNGKTNVAIHIRQDNKGDVSWCPPTILPMKYYTSIIKIIREKYPDAVYHIYSQGDIKDFECLKDVDVFHLNENIIDTFQGLVASDVFIMSHSTLSYSAALLNSGEIHFKKCEPLTPMSHWIIHK